jgi:hypothetical protein
MLIDLIFTRHNSLLQEKHGGWINVLKSFLEVKMNNNYGSSSYNDRLTDASSPLTTEVIKDVLAMVKPYVYALEEASHPIPFITYGIYAGGLYACSTCTFVTFKAGTIKQHSCIVKGRNNNTETTYDNVNEKVVVFRMGGKTTTLYRVCCTNEHNKLFIDQVLLLL